MYLVVEYGDFVLDILMVLGVLWIECVFDVKFVNFKILYVYIYVCMDIVECYCNIFIIFFINLWLGMFI